MRPAAAPKTSRAASEAPRSLGTLPELVRHFAGDSKGRKVQLEPLFGRFGGNQPNSLPNRYLPTPLERLDDFSALLNWTLAPPPPKPLLMATSPTHVLQLPTEMSALPFA